MLLGEGTHLYRIVNNKCRLYIIAFAFFAEELVYQFTLTHACLNRDMQLSAYIPKACFIHFAYINIGMFFYRIVNAYTFKGSLKADDLIAHRYISGAMKVDRNPFH